MFETNFTNLDWIIVGVYLAVSVLIGVLVNRFIHNVSNYMVGGRGSGAALNVATYIGTGLGLVTLMYASIDAFSNGFAYVTLAVIAVIVGVFLGATGFVIGPLRRMELTTLPEYFERRYNKSVRVVAGSICAIAGILNMGLFPKMGATFITGVTGLATDVDPEHAQMLVNIVTSALIVLVLIYTVLGGMVSVIVTDFIQFIVLSIGLGVGVYYCLTLDNLGWTNITQTMMAHHGEGSVNPFANQNYGWSWVTFNFFVISAALLCWAPEATRVLTSKSERATRLTFLFAGPGHFIRLAIPALLAVAALALVSQDAQLTAHFFPNGFDAEPRHAAAAMPLLIGRIVPTGVLGILVAGLMAAFMSTHDSYLLGWASIITRDVVNPMRRLPLPERQQITLTRLIVVVIGAFLLFWGVWYPLPASVWIYMAITGSIYLSGAGVVLIGGMYWRGASSVGALCALFGGLISLLGLVIGWLQNIIGLWITPVYVGLFSFTFCATIFVVMSLLFPDQKQNSEQPT